MAIIKCKMCGGDVELTQDKTVGICEYCGSTMTFPKIDDEQRAAAFNRGNHFRRIGEFDKALAVYERIVREDENDAEAHWCCALCRFGIEYVEDPATMEWLPTCHRASFDSFLEDVDYLAALNHSDGLTRRQYQKDAAKIADVQRGILATSQNAEPYDVFICYKESDENGQRTVDSTLAQDIYYQLTEQGRKVFFARITLEDVAGTQYEPYIFAALNSAKVMIVVGTKPEHLNAVWVKNEWSRFLAMMKKDHHKLLLPCYRDMDPYDLPEQLSVLQSYDMAKIGFIQDLIRGVAKVLDAQQKPVAVKETVVVNQAAPATNIAPLLKRAFMFLEDGDWDRADNFCEQVLNIDPECAQAYIGKLMIDLEVNLQDDLGALEETFEDNLNYQKAMRYGDQAIQTTLQSYIHRITERQNEEAYQAALAMMNDAEEEYDFKRAAAEFILIQDYKDSEELAFACIDKAEQAKQEKLECQYQAIHASMRQATSESEFQNVATLFERMGDYKDSATLAKQCTVKAEEVRKDAILQKALFVGEKKRDFVANKIDDYRWVVEQLQSISGWRDADEWIDRYQQELTKLRNAEAARIKAEKEEAALAAKNRLILTGVVGCATLVLVVFFVILSTVIIPHNNYNAAVEAMTAGKYEQAIATFKEIKGYKDSDTLPLVCYYLWACDLEEEGQTAKAAITFGKAQNYSDARTRSFALWDQIADRKTIDAGGYHVVGLRTDGTVKVELSAEAKHDGVGPSYNFGQADVYGWSDIIAVSAGYGHTVGLKSDGTVLAVGDHYSGQCVVSGWRDIVAICAGYNETIGLKSDGTVVAAGDYGDFSGWTDIVAISTNRNHTVGLKADGTVVAVGDNNYGQCDVSGWTDIVAISAGNTHTVGLKKDGTVVTVGEDDLEQCNVSGWKDIVAISACGGLTMGVKADGTVESTSYSDYGADRVYGWSGLVDISTDYGHTIGLKADGTVIHAGSDPTWCNVSGWSNILIPTR